MNSHESTPIATNSGLLPKGWQVVSLRDAIEELKNGFASGKRDENGIVQIRMNNVTTDGRLIFDSYLKVPVPENLNYWLLKKGDLLFNNTNSIDLVGKSAIFNDAPFPCTFSNHFTRLRFKKELVLPELILYHFLILWEKSYFKSVAIRHVGQSAVHTNYLLKLQLPLPLSPEQRRIAEVLGTVDSAIQKVGGAIESTERLKKGLMQRLLTRGIGHERFKSSKELGCEIPEEWAVDRLEGASANITDGSHFSPKEDKNGTYKIATVANIKENKIDIDSCKKISKEDYEMLVKNGCKAKIGDILFSKDGTVGLSFSYKQNEDIVLLSSIAIITPKESLYSDYCSYVLKSPFVFQQIMGSKRGTGLKRVILQDLKRIKIPLPPLPEQRRIAEILSAADRKLELERRRKEKLERVKKGLMNELLTGRKRVKI